MLNKNNSFLENKGFLKLYIVQGINIPILIHIKVDVKLTIGVTLDMCNRTLAFDIEGKYLGIAFRDLPAMDLFPAISSVFGNTEVSILYRGSPFVG